MFALATTLLLLLLLALLALTFAITRRGVIGISAVEAIRQIADRCQTWLVANLQTLGFRLGWTTAIVTTLVSIARLIREIKVVDEFHRVFAITTSILHARLTLAFTIARRVDNVIDVFSKFWQIWSVLNLETLGFRFQWTTGFLGFAFSRTIHQFKLIKEFTRGFLQKCLAFAAIITTTNPLELLAPAFTVASHNTFRVVCTVRQVAECWLTGMMTNLQTLRFGCRRTTAYVKGLAPARHHRPIRDIRLVDEFGQDVTYVGRDVTAVNDPMGHDVIAPEDLQNDAIDFKAAADDDVDAMEDVEYNDPIQRHGIQQRPRNGRNKRNGGSESLLRKTRGYGLRKPKKSTRSPSKRVPSFQAVSRVTTTGQEMMDVQMVDAWEEEDGEEEDFMDVDEGLAFDSDLIRQTSSGLTTPISFLIVSC
ncbi:hypothetical protein HDU67_009936 [Dinochytrium kinnereticum]|nr:hypothetical protein HDU67_009936 [Dinochytrium kinnereticum]